MSVRCFRPVGQANGDGGEGVGSFFGGDKPIAVLGDERGLRGQKAVGDQMREGLTLNSIGGRREFVGHWKCLGVERFAPGFQILDEAVERDGKLVAGDRLVSLETPVFIRTHDTLLHNALD